MGVSGRESEVGVIVRDFDIKGAGEGVSNVGKFVR